MHIALYAARTYGRKQRIRGVFVLATMPIQIHICIVPRTHTGFGDQAFQVAGPKLSAGFTASVHTTVGQFKKLLKTHLFS